MVGFGQRWIFCTAGKEHPSPPLPSPAVGEVLKLDSIAVSVFADILIELTNTVSDGKIRLTILILRRGALSNLTTILIRDAQTWPTFFSTSPTELSLPTFRVLAPSQPRLGYHKQAESIYFQILFFKNQIWKFLWYFLHSQVPLLLPQWDDLSRQLHEEDFQLHQRNSNVRKPWKT